MRDDAVGAGLYALRQNVPREAMAGLAEALAAQHIRVSMAPRLRLVTHLDVTRADMETTAQVFASYFRK